MLFPCCPPFLHLPLLPPYIIRQYWWAAAAAAKSLQLCLILRNPIDGSPPGSPVPGILQARTLEWVAIVFSNAWKWKVKVKSLNRVQLPATPWTAAYQAPPSLGFARQEYWSGVPLPSPLMSWSLVILKKFPEYSDVYLRLKATGYLKEQWTWKTLAQKLDLLLNSDKWFVFSIMSLLRIK